MLAALTLAACVVLPDRAPASNEVYDDPAIAICETMVKSTLPTGAQYERTTAAIEGATVRLDYMVSILNTRPRAQNRSCDFILNDDGKFKLRGHEPARRDCQPEIAATKAAQNLRTSDQRQQMVRAGDALQACHDVLKRDLAIMARELVDREMPLISTGIYPIAREDTALTAE